MRMWIVAMVLVLASRARADDAGVTIDGFVVDGVIVEGRAVYAERVLPYAVVRVVGERVVVIARADARGHVHVTRLPAGAYRLEVEHGAFTDHAPPPLHLDRERVGERGWIHSEHFGPVFTAAIGARPAAPQRPFIDTSSTALVTIFDGH